jgi:long-chain acyl-CoA synthetase
MSRKSLVEFFQDYFSPRSNYLEYDNGFRRWTYTYCETAQAAHAFATRLRTAGVRQGEKVLLWSENRPEWVFAFWGSLLTGAVVVPVGAESSAEFVGKVARIAKPRVIALGEDPRLEAKVSAQVLRLAREDWIQPADPSGPSASARDDLAEIVFTSGSTGEPKGVEITHGNLLSQIEAVESWLASIRKFVRPFFPIRLLQLLPLSHMFGQATTFSLAPLVRASVVMTRRQSPVALAELIRNRGVCAALCVPRVLNAFQALASQRMVSEPRPRGSGTSTEQEAAFVRRLRRARRVRHLFGWRFLGFMLGGAALDPELERFWSGLGYLVVQGYGLTETAPVVSVNNPLHPRQGSVGQLFPGVEARIARDGEILVRGPNVSPGYYNEPQRTFEAMGDGWLHTGDLGSLDDDGYLFIRGRKKEMIVTPEGVNIFPEDIERVLDAIPGVREAAVVGLPLAGDGQQEHAHAVLELAQGRDAAEVMAEANRRLESYQRIRGVFVWPEENLPRTPQTGKLKRAEIRERMAAERTREPSVPGGQSTDMVTEEIERRTGRKVSGESGLDELGLSSVDRVEMLLEFEGRSGRSMEESELAAARTVNDLKAVVDRAMALEESGAAARAEFPAWNRSWLARLVRAFNLSLWVLPLARFLGRPTVEGLENLRRVKPPVIFAANHESNLDGPLILATLPSRWRRRIAPAMYKEFFDPHFSPEKYSLARRMSSSFQYYLVALLGNAFPIPQEEAGVRDVLRYAGELVSESWSLLIFPEGERRPAGRHGGFRPGVGLLAQRLEAPVIPVYLEGTGQVLPPGQILPRRGRTRVVFGLPLRLEHKAPDLLALDVEEAVASLAGAGFMSLARQ